VALLFLLSAFTGPTLAAFMMTSLVSGRSGIRQLLRRYIQWRAGLRYGICPPSSSRFLAWGRLMDRDSRYWSSVGRQTRCCGHGSLKAARGFPSPSRR
jgi:hypothetical protein